MLFMSVLDWSKQHRRKHHQLSTPQQLENCKFVVFAIGAYSFVGNFFVLYLLFDFFDGVGVIIYYYFYYYDKNENEKFFWWW